MDEVKRELKDAMNEKPPKRLNGAVAEGKPPPLIWQTAPSQGKLKLSWSSPASLAREPSASLC